MNEPNTTAENDEEAHRERAIVEIETRHGSTSTEEEVLDNLRTETNCSTAGEQPMDNSSEQSYQRGDEVTVSDLPEWKHPLKVAVAYSGGALKVENENGAWWHVSADEVDDVVSPVKPESKLMAENGEELANEIPRGTWEMIDEMQTAVRILANLSNDLTQSDREQYQQLADEAGEYLVQVEVSDG